MIFSFCKISHSNILQQNLIAVQELYTLFQNHEDRLLGSLGSQRRARILKHLFKAKPIVESSDGLNLKSENYRLVIGERIGYSFTGQSCQIPTSGLNEGSNLDRQSRTVPLELWEYLESLRNPRNKPRPTFYFSDHRAGPDLVFALEPIEPEIDMISERILCVVQVKTGSMDNVPYAIMTTDLSQAFLDKSTNKPEVKMLEYNEYCIMCTLYRAVACCCIITTQ